MCEKKGPESNKAFANLARPMPWRRKLHLILVNNFRKLRKRQVCCGNPGQPGC
ncbi:MAG: hypothetical protein R6W72_06725 [Desulfurivibrionaceae bacterium]